ncbi:MAG: ROK family protein [Candidatus Omnitrophica bacterium]|nr:ROK family protein [Candidatus Omnitrophota bacterium]
MKTERESGSDKDGYVIGIEIDKLCIKVSLFDSRLKPLEKVSFSADNVKNIGAKCADLIEELIKKSGIKHDEMKGIGIGTGAIAASLAKKIENKFNIRTFYAGTAVCAALGEIYLNPEADSAENILYIYSDLGACAVLKSRNLEILPQAVSGYLGPWDASFGITAIAKREVERGVGTKIAAACEGRIDRIDDAAVLEAARRDDEVAVNIVHSVGVTLGVRIAYLVNLVGPQAVIFGGGLEKAGGLLIEPIKNIIKKLALKSRSESLKIIPGKSGEDAASLGAASLAIREISCNS